MHSRILAAVAAAAAAVLALTGCAAVAAGSGSDPNNPNQLEAFTWWVAGSEKVGLDALVGVFAEQHPGHRVHQRLGRGRRRFERQGGPGRPARGRQPARHVPGPRGCRAHRLHRGRPAAGPEPVLRRERPHRRVPRVARRPPHGRRQDLLGAQQHPPRQRGVGQHRGARRRRASTRRPRPRPSTSGSTTCRP